MIILIYILAVVGAGVVGFILLTFISEIIRAARQSRRLGAAMIRCGEEKRHCSYRQWWALFKGEFFNTYTDLVVGPWKLPHNPNTPAKPAYHVHHYHRD